MCPPDSLGVKLAQKPENSQKLLGWSHETRKMGPQKMKMGTQDLLKQTWEGCNLLKRKIGVNRPGKNYWPIPNVSETQSAVPDGRIMPDGFQVSNASPRLVEGPFTALPIEDGKTRDFLYNLPSVESIDIEFFLMLHPHLYIPRFFPYSDWFLCLTSPLLVKGVPWFTAQLRCQDRRVLGEGRLVPEAQGPRACFMGPVRWLLLIGSTLGNSPGDFAQQNP